MQPARRNTVFNYSTEQITILSRPIRPEGNQIMNIPAQGVLPLQSGLPAVGGRPSRHMPRLLDQVRQALAHRHSSLKAEQAVVYWVKFFIRWHGMRHPRELGTREVEAFLTMLRQREDLSPASWSQAASALTFLYRDVLGHPVATPLPASASAGKSGRRGHKHPVADWDWFGANQPQH